MCCNYRGRRTVGQTAIYWIKCDPPPTPYPSQSYLFSFSLPLKKSVDGVYTHAIWYHQMHATMYETQNLWINVSPFSYTMWLPLCSHSLHLSIYLLFCVTICSPFRVTANFMHLSVLFQFNSGPAVNELKSLSLRWMWTKVIVSTAIWNCTSWRNIMQEVH